MTDVGGKPRPSDGATATARDRDEFPLVDAEHSRDLRMQLDERLRVLDVELLDATCLGARLVLRHHATGGQGHRVLGVRLLCGRPVGDHVKSCAAVRRGEPVEEHPRSAGMALGGTRPEDAVASRDPLVCDAGVVGGASGARTPKLVEDGGGLGGGKQRSPAKPLGKTDDDLGVGTHAIGRIDGAAAQQHAPLEVRHRFLFLGPLRRRQHDVPAPGRLGEERVDDRQEVERCEPLLDRLGTRSGDDRVRPHHQERAHAVRRAETVEQLVGGPSGARDLRRVDAPHRRDMRPRRGVVDRAVPRELIRLLAVFASALAVALTRRPPPPVPPGRATAQPPFSGVSADGLLDTPKADAHFATPSSSPRFAT